MFFAPTLLGLIQGPSKSKDGLEHLEANYEEVTPSADVYSLCLSSGNSEGLGEIRKRELGDSLDVLGIGIERRWVLDEPFQDNITLFWNAKLIADHVRPYVEENGIDVIITFDDRGISSHPNHISLIHGARELLANSPGNNLRAFSLKTVGIISKYTGAGAALFAKLEQAFCSITPGLPLLYGLLLDVLPALPGGLRITDCTKYDAGETGSSVLFVSGWKEYMTALRAMRMHRSQLVWFRWLYVAFSRYMWVNELNEIVVS
ncbi:LmbE-like protein [Fomitiporia mediterranea MF3/22]|uniref:N-acetylglucosaminylphosphatidylinositol deacetylase n=1 Tax=Fomitiporia mediterranea (strain MF3/22) TaxID=694068 RepID=R7SJ86_FOMME|nr:LmbE-like protein [Fomitiporia mediterranea MF3/22]EJC97674.1 LmbE-like protein [Fomitiporia mediterranea MF3/22]